MTTSEEVVTFFTDRSKKAKSAFESWQCNPERKSVVPVVMAHDSSYVLDVTISDVIAVCKQTEHALGESNRKISESVTTIRDWNPAFAFTHILHYCLESLRQVPTFDEFRQFVASDPIAREFLHLPAKSIIEQAVVDGFGRSDARAALRWRIGNAYYSFIRELHVLAVLRSKGVDVRLHPLADALFRVDIWSDDLLINLFVGNTKYRSGLNGRKLSSEKLLSDANPAFKFLSIELQAQKRFGIVHLADEKVIHVPVIQ